MTVRLRSIIAGVLAVAVILFLFRNYYGGNGVLFGDANFLWAPSLLHAELAQMLHVWRPAAAGGTPGAIANASQSFVWLQALFSPFGIPLSTVLVFPFLLSAGAFSFYRFARDLGARPFGAFAGAIFFLGNPWTLDQMLAGHVAIVAAVVFSPFIFSAFLRLRHGAIAYGFLLLALCAVELAFDPRISIFVFAALLIAGVAVFFSSRAAQPRHAGAVLAFAIAAPFFAALCNGEWTILYTLGPDPNLVPFFYPPVEDLMVYSWFGDFWHSLVLSAYFIHFSWTSADVWGALTFAPWYAAVTGVLLIPLLGAPKRRLAYVLAAAAVVLGVVFSMGTHSLAPGLLYWTYSHVPLLSLLREPAKFGYLAMFGASVLAALAMGRMAGFWRALLFLAVIVAVVPVFFGNLSVPEGYGFQDFSARPAYVRMLEFLERRHAREDFRVAFFPPWLAEQSLSKGAFYTANPFVIQNEIPVLDAKLINTATKTSEQAWQAFYGIYSGIDTHPAATLAQFGVKYVVVADGVHLSAAAGITPFAYADDALNDTIAASDRNFQLVYSDGPNRIYQNLRFRPIFRTPRTPLVAGAVPAVMRQMFPADTFGDAVTPGAEPQRLPDGAMALFADGYQGGCFDMHGELASINAYYRVSKHADWTGYWVASDYTVSAPDNYRSRILQRFPLPFAYTESQTPIAVPFSAKRSGVFYAEAATVGSSAILETQVDGAQKRSFQLSSQHLQWFRLGHVAAGEHTVSITGSPAGTVLRRIVLDDGTCPGSTIGQEPLMKSYFLPGPLRSVTVEVGVQKTAVRLARLAEGGAANNTAPWLLSTPPGAVAAAWDYVPVVSGRPFPSLTGFHRVTFFAPAGEPLTGTWQASDAAKNDLHLTGSRWPQHADVTIAHIPEGQSTLADLSIAGTIRGARIAVIIPGGRTMTLEADALRTPFLLIPYVGPSYTISLVTPANSTGSLRFGVDVRVAAPDGDPQIVRIPSVAVVSAALASAHSLTPIATFELQANGDLQPLQFSEIGVPIGSQQGLVLHLKGLRANGAGRAIVTAFYGSWANLPSVKIADVAVASKPENYDVAVPAAPFTENVAFTVVPDDSRLTLAFAGASLANSDPLEGGVLQDLPVMHTTGGVPVAANDSRIETIPFSNPAGGLLVGAFTYDPHWTIGSQPHWEVNGYANAWRAGARGTVVYNLQQLYIGLLVLGIVLWLAAVAAFVVLQLRSRRTLAPQEP